MALYVRHIKNCDGPFYVVEDECLDCCIVESVARSLMPPIEETGGACYFQRQPINVEETEWACQAVLSCCTQAIRYGGKDPDVIRRLYNAPQHCDYTLDKEGSLVPSELNTSVDVVYSQEDRTRWNTYGINREERTNNGT